MRTMTKLSRRGLLAAAPALRQAPRLSLPEPHRKLATAPQRIFFQHDSANFEPPDMYGMEIGKWLRQRFGFMDEPGNQIDTYCLDISNEGILPYASRILPRWQQPGLQKWWDQGIDFIERIVTGCHQRKIRCFWNHRMSEVERGVGGFRIGGGVDLENWNPLKRAHPDWVIPTWWWQGHWNLAAPGLREFKLSVLEELVRRYDLDGLQLDFARHVPVLPPGSQWEYRDEATQFVAMVRRMLLRRGEERGRPFLLGVRVPQNLKGCRIDGFDVQQWVDRGLIDILALGSRSVDVDIASFRDLTRRSHVRLQPSLDDWHATDGYRNPPIEFFRGVFGNWWRQGAHSVATMNWASASPVMSKEAGALASPVSHGEAIHEIGSLETTKGSRFYVVERRGGYPFAEGYFNRNDDAPLPAALANSGGAAIVRLPVWEDLRRWPRDLVLRVVFHQMGPGDAVEVAWNGAPLVERRRDRDWRDGQILSPEPQPVSGGHNFLRKASKQELTMVEYAVAPPGMRVGGNTASLRVAKRGPFRPTEAIRVEKVELHVDETA